MGTREVAMIMGCLEKFSARREREVDDSKRIFYRKKDSEAERIAKKILIGTIRNGFYKAFLNSCKREIWRKNGSFLPNFGTP